MAHLWRRIGAKSRATRRLRHCAIGGSPYGREPPTLSLWRRRKAWRGYGAKARTKRRGCSPWAKSEGKEKMLRRWWLTPTALFRSHMPPVFLRPMHWPKGCWQCCGQGLATDPNNPAQFRVVEISPALHRLFEASDVLIYLQK